MRSRISPSRSSTWLPTGRISISGIEQARRADDLLDDDALGLLQLVLGRRRGHEDRLRGARLPLVEPQRAVVERRRQAEAEVDQRLLARAVAFVHRRDLRDGLVRLVDEQQVVLREVIEQRRRRLARRAPRQVARVVLDALAAPHLLEHLEVVHRALLQALLLDQLVLGLELGQALAQLFFDARHGARQLVGRRDVVRAGEDRDLVDLPQHLAAQRIDLRDRVDLVAEPLDADRLLPLVGREDLDGVAADAEGAARKVDVVALVLNLDEAAQHGVAPDLDPARQIQLHPQVGLGGADAVDARDRRDDEHVAPGQQRVRRRVAHAIDLFVDERVLLDVRVGRGDVRLGLVVVVVADEVVDGVVREQVLEFPVQLVRQRLVVRHDQRRPLNLLDDVGHREGLAAAGDAEQHL